MTSPYAGWPLQLAVDTETRNQSLLSTTSKPAYVVERRGLCPIGEFTKHIGVGFTGLLHLPFPSSCAPRHHLDSCGKLLFAVRGKPAPTDEVECRCTSTPCAASADSAESGACCRCPPGHTPDHCPLTK